MSRVVENGDFRFIPSLSSEHFIYMQPHDSFQMIRLSITLGIFQGLFQTFDDLEVHLKVISA